MIVPTEDEEPPYGRFARVGGRIVSSLLFLIFVTFLLFALLMLCQAVIWAASPHYYGARSMSEISTVADPLPPHRAVTPRASRSEIRKVPDIRARADIRGPSKKLTQPVVGWPWTSLVTCEAPDRGWRYGAPGVGIDPGYYFEGGLNFTHSTWVSFGGLQYAEHAWDASPAEQITVAERVLAAQGWVAWPDCSRKLGLR